MDLFEKSVRNREQPAHKFLRYSDRRKNARAPTLRSSYTAMTSHPWVLELVPANALDRLQGNIADLSERSLEPNIFFDGTVLRSAWPRLTSLLSPQGCWMLCLWETVNEEQRLQCFFPIGITKVGLRGHKVLTPLANVFMPIGTPLLDANQAGETAETLLRLLADENLSLPGVLDLNYQREAGPTLAVIQEAAKSLGLTYKTNNRFERAALVAPKDPATFAAKTLGKKKARELARQMRQISDGGEVEFIRSQDGNEVLDAFERFVTLELRSWKGRGGSALYNHKKIASFSRQIVAELAASHRCEILWLKQANGYESRMIAGVILLGDGNHLVPWKMAFDEAFSAQSPGMQVMLQATLELIRDDRFICADSLAASDHWMMNHLWTDRLAICDMAIALRPDAQKSLPALIADKERLNALHNRAKAWLKRLQKAFRRFKN